MQVFRSQQVLTPSGLRPADVQVAGDHIAAITPWDANATDVIDFGNAVLSPGLVDVHCHINDPHIQAGGRGPWEGFNSATRAAAAGGITLLCDMPLNSEPVTTTAHALDEKVSVSTNRLQVDVALYGGLVPSNADRPQELHELARAGAAAFKCFLCDSGLASFAHVGRAHLESAMPEIRRLGKRLLAHAELFEADKPAAKHPKSYQDAISQRPAEAELRAIDLLAELCASTGCAVHIVHLGASEALPRLAQLRHQGLPITVETCPHYLTFCAEQLTLDPRNKCTPPMRHRANREALWQGLAGGVIDFIASDHSPCPPELKLTSATGESERWSQAWGGIASLQLMLPAVASQALKRGHSFHELSQWLSERPAAWLGLNDRGILAPGQRADFVAWHPEQHFVVRGEDLEHRHAETPYEGIKLTGVVQTTVLAGQLAYDKDRQPKFSRKNGQALRLRHGNLADQGPDALEDVKSLDTVALSAWLSNCCGAKAWVRSMLHQLPCATEQRLAEASERAFDQLNTADWHQAFRAHPRIGDIASLKKKFAATEALASQEQASTADADQATLEALALGNANYEEKFGHVFLICATGQSADTMLLELQRRLSHSAETELAIASEEQRKITYLRLMLRPELRPKH